MIQFRMKIKLVRQLNSKGCGIACAAMITGLPYTEIRLHMFGSLGKVTGMFHDDVVKFATERGFKATAKKYFHEFEGRKIKPLAKLNLIEGKVFHDSEQGHFMVMDGRGKVYDPLLGITDLSFYHEVWSVVGLTK